MTSTACGANVATWGAWLRPFVADARPLVSQMTIAASLHPTSLAQMKQAVGNYLHTLKTIHTDLLDTRVKLSACAYWKASGWTQTAIAIIESAYRRFLTGQLELCLTLETDKTGRSDMTTLAKTLQKVLVCLTKEDANFAAVAETSVPGESYLAMQTLTERGPLWTNVNTVLSSVRKYALTSEEQVNRARQDVSNEILRFVYGMDATYFELTAENVSRWSADNDWGAIFQATMRLRSATAILRQLSFRDGLALEILETAALYFSLEANRRSPLAPKQASQLGAAFRCVGEFFSRSLQIVCSVKPIRLFDTPLPPLEVDHAVQDVSYGQCIDRPPPKIPPSLCCFSAPSV